MVVVDKLYFLKIGRVRYLMSNNNKKNCCQVCGKKRKTTAHHIIPKRLHCICPLLSEIRIRVCNECDLLFHPENMLIRESDIIKKQSKNISNLREAISWRENKTKDIINGVKKINEESIRILGLNNEDFYINKNGK